MSEQTAVAVTKSLVIAVVLLLAGWDCYAFTVSPTKAATISRVLGHWADTIPHFRLIVTFLVGLLLGHSLWSMDGKF